MFLPKCSKIAILVQVEIFDKKYFWTHVTVGSCSMLDFKDVNFFIEFSIVQIARY